MKYPLLFSSFKVGPLNLWQPERKKRLLELLSRRVS